IMPSESAPVAAGTSVTFTVVVTNEDIDRFPPPPPPPPPTPQPVPVPPASGGGDASYPPPHHRCAASTFAGTVALPMGFTQSARLPALTISPRESARAELTVTSAANLADGRYPITVTYANRRFPRFRGSATATYVLQSSTCDQNVKIAQEL